MTAAAAVAAVKVRENAVISVKSLRGKVTGCVAVGAVKNTGPTDRDQSGTGPTFLIPPHAHDVMRSGHVIPSKLTSVMCVGA